MQDNAPCHKAQKVMGLFEEGISLMKWPAQSPKLNPIENVWKLIGERAQKRNLKNQDHLWELLKDEWKGITADFCKKLINVVDDGEKSLKIRGCLPNIKFC